MDGPMEDGFNPLDESSDDGALLTQEAAPAVKVGSSARKAKSPGRKITATPSSSLSKKRSKSASSKSRGKKRATRADTDDQIKDSDDDSTAAPHATKTKRKRPKVSLSKKDGKISTNSAGKQTKPKRGRSTDKGQLSGLDDVAGDGSADEQNSRKPKKLAKKKKSAFATTPSTLAPAPASAPASASAPESASASASASAPATAPASSSKDIKANTKKTRRTVGNGAAAASRNKIYVSSSALPKKGPTSNKSRLPVGNEPDDAAEDYEGDEQVWPVSNWTDHVDNLGRDERGLLELKLCSKFYPVCTAPVTPLGLSTTTATTLPTSSSTVTATAGAINGTGVSVAAGVDRNVPLTPSLSNGAASIAKSITPVTVAGVISTTPPTAGATSALKLNGVATDGDASPPLSPTEQLTCTIPLDAKSRLEEVSEQNVDNSTYSFDEEGTWMRRLDRFTLVLQSTGEMVPIDYLDTDRARGPAVAFGTLLSNKSLLLMSSNGTVMPQPDRSIAQEEALGQKGVRVMLGEVKDWALDYTHGDHSVWLITDLAWYKIGGPQSGLRPAPYYVKLFNSTRKLFEACSQVVNVLVQFVDNGRNLKLAAKLVFDQVRSRSHRGGYGGALAGSWWSVPCPITQRFLSRHGSFIYDQICSLEEDTGIKYSEVRFAQIVKTRGEQFAAHDAMIKEKQVKRDRETAERRVAAEQAKQTRRDELKRNRAKRGNRAKNLLKARKELSRYVTKSQRIYKLMELQATKYPVDDMLVWRMAHGDADAIVEEFPARKSAVVIARELELFKNGPPAPWPCPSDLVGSVIPTVAPEHMRSIKCLQTVIEHSKVAHRQNQGNDGVMATTMVKNESTAAVDAVGIIASDVGMIPVDGGVDVTMLPTSSIPNGKPHKKAIAPGAQFKLPTIIQSLPVEMKVVVDPVRDAEVIARGVELGRIVEIWNILVRFRSMLKLTTSDDEGDDKDDEQQLQLLSLEHFERCVRDAGGSESGSGGGSGTHNLICQAAVQMLQVLLTESKQQMLDTIGLETLEMNLRDQVADHMHGSSEEFSHLTVKRGVTRAEKNRCLRSAFEDDLHLRVLSASTWQEVCRSFLANHSECTDLHWLAGPSGNVIEQCDRVMAQLRLFGGDDLYLFRNPGELARRFLSASDDDDDAGAGDTGERRGGGTRHNLATVLAVLRIPEKSNSAAGSGSSGEDALDLINSCYYFEPITLHTIEQRIEKDWYNPVRALKSAVRADEQKRPGRRRRRRPRAMSEDPLLMAKLLAGVDNDGNGNDNDDDDADDVDGDNETQPSQATGEGGEVARSARDSTSSKHTEPRVALWNVLSGQRLFGGGGVAAAADVATQVAPTVSELSAFLKEHPQLEVYRGQDLNLDVDDVGAEAAKLDILLGKGGGVRAFMRDVKALWVPFQRQSVANALVPPVIYDATKRLDALLDSLCSGLVSTSSTGIPDTTPASFKVKWMRKEDSQYDQALAENILSNPTSEEGKRDAEWQTYVRAADALKISPWMLIPPRSASPSSSAASSDLTADATSLSLQSLSVIAPCVMAEYLEKSRAFAENRGTIPSNGGGSGDFALFGFASGVGAGSGAKETTALRDLICQLGRLEFSELPMADRIQVLHTLTQQFVRSEAVRSYLAQNHEHWHEVKRELKEAKADERRERLRLAQRKASRTFWRVEEMRKKAMKQLEEKEKDKEADAADPLNIEYSIDLFEDRESDVDTDTEKELEDAVWALTTELRKQQGKKSRPRPPSACLTRGDGRGAPRGRKAATARNENNDDGAAVTSPRGADVGADEDGGGDDTDDDENEDDGDDGDGDYEVGDDADEEEEEEEEEEDGEDGHNNNNNNDDDNNNNNKNKNKNKNSGGVDDEEIRSQPSATRTRRSAKPTVTSPSSERGGRNNKNNTNKKKKSGDKRDTTAIVSSVAVDVDMDGDGKHATKESNETTKQEEKKKEGEESDVEIPPERLLAVKSAVFKRRQGEGQAKQEAKASRKLAALSRVYDCGLGMRALGRDRFFRRYTLVALKGKAQHLLVEDCAHHTGLLYKYQCLDDIEALLHWLNPLGKREMGLKLNLSQVLPMLRTTLPQSFPLVSAAAPAGKKEKKKMRKRSVSQDISLETNGNGDDADGVGCDVVECVDCMTLMQSMEPLVGVQFALGSQGDLDVQGPMSCSNRRKISLPKLRADMTRTLQFWGIVAGVQQPNTALARTAQSLVARLQKCGALQSASWLAIEDDWHARVKRIGETTSSATRNTGNRSDQEEAKQQEREMLHLDRLSIWMDLESELHAMVNFEGAALRRDWDMNRITRLKDLELHALTATQLCHRLVTLEDHDIDWDFVSTYNKTCSETAWAKRFAATTKGQPSAWLPDIGDKLVYFPEGHVEHMQAMYDDLLERLDVMELDANHRAWLSRYDTMEKTALLSHHIGHGDGKHAPDSTTPFLCRVEEVTYYVGIDKPFYKMRLSHVGLDQSVLHVDEAPPGVVEVDVPSSPAVVPPPLPTPPRARRSRSASRSSTGAVFSTAALAAIGKGATNGVGGSSDVDECKEVVESAHWDRLIKSNRSPQDELAVQLAEVLRVLKSLPASSGFLRPVSLRRFPSYHKLVTTAMDLQAITIKVGERAYNSVDEFLGDVTLILDNAKKYSTKKWPNIVRSADNVVKRTAKECEKLKQARAAISQRKVAGSNTNNDVDGDTDEEGKQERVLQGGGEGERGRAVGKKHTSASAIVTASHMFDVEISPSALRANGTGGIDFLQELGVYKKLMLSQDWCTHLSARFCTSMDNDLTVDTFAGTVIACRPEVQVGLPVPWRPLMVVLDDGDVNALEDTSELMKVNPWEIHQIEHRERRE